MTAIQTTRFLLGEGVEVRVESWDQLPVETRQQIRLEAMKLVDLLRPFNVALVQIGHPKNLRDA